MLSRKGSRSLGELTKTFEWEEKRNDDRWVMEALGNKMLTATLSRAPTMDLSGKAPPSPAPAVAWRLGCKAHGSNCRRYDPVLVLPLSLCSRQEASTELQRKAAQVLEEAQGKLPGGLGKGDLEVEVSEMELAHRREARCHALSFRVSRRKCHLTVELARSSAATRDRMGPEGEAAARLLDRHQYEANVSLLQCMLAWAEEWRAVKQHKVEAARQCLGRQQQLEAETELRRTAIEQRLLGFPAGSEQPSTSSRAWRPRSTGPVGAAALPAKPTICCRCGQPEVFHEPEEPKAPAFVAPWLQLGRHGRSVAAGKQAVDAGGSAVLSGGVLRKAGAHCMSLQC